MAISIAVLAGGQSSNGHGTGPAPTDTFTPNDGDLLVVVVDAQENSGQTGPSEVGDLLTLASVGSSLTWTAIERVTWNNAGPGGPNNGAFNLGMAFFAAQVVTGSDHAGMAVSPDCGSVFVHSYVTRVYAVRGEQVVVRAVGELFDNGTPNGSPPFVITLDDVVLSDSLILAAVAEAGDNAVFVVPSSGWTSLNFQTPEFQVYNAMRRTGPEAGTGNTATWSEANSNFGANFGRVGIAVEFAIDTGGGGNVDVNCDTGVYSIVGPATTILQGEVLEADTGVYAIEGPAVQILQGEVLEADTGVYALVGPAITILDSDLQAETGIYNIVGPAITIIGAAEGEAVRIVALGSFRDSVTYWPVPVPDGLGGYNFNSPEVIKTRWEQKTELTFDELGEQFVSQARVYVDDNKSLDVGGYLYLGVSVAADPSDVKGAFKIRNFIRTPALRGPRSNNKALL